MVMKEPPAQQCGSLMCFHGFWGNNGERRYQALDTYPTTLVSGIHSVLVWMCTLKHNITRRILSNTEWRDAKQLYKKKRNYKRSNSYVALPHERNIEQVSKLNAFLSFCDSAAEKRLCSDSQQGPDDAGAAD